MTMSTTRYRPARSLSLGIIIVVACMSIADAHAQHMVNDTTGRVRNRGVLRFRSDSGSFKNAAPYVQITNDSVIEMRGTRNRFTDVNGSVRNARALGQDPAWRVPGKVRFLRDTMSQTVDARYYTDLEVAGGAPKTVLDSVFVGRDYEHNNTGARAYQGTFFYDGTILQTITDERGLSSNTDRYNNLTLLNGPKQVRNGDQVWVSGNFYAAPLARTRVEGDLYMGVNAIVDDNMRIDNDGTVTTGSGATMLNDSLDVARGKFIVPDDAGIVTVGDTSALSLRSDSAASLAMGLRTRLDVLGEFVNRYPLMTNVEFAASSLVNYDGTRPQVMQATVEDHAYGSLRTARSGKTANGDIFLVDSLSVNDTDVVMVPHRMSMKLGAASYTNNAEVVGRLRRDLDGAQTGVAYVYNNAETFFDYMQLPREMTLDVRPVTRPNAYDSTTDVQRKITVSGVGNWEASVRAGYKQTDIPPTWASTTAENLMKMYNAYAPPNERALKLLPTLPPTYQRRLLSQSNGMAYLQLMGLRNTGNDSLRLDNGNDLLLRASRDIIKAIASGRWSNPNTWDEAREPEPIDRVLIDGFTVHAGYVRTIDNYTIREAWPDSMATSVLIGSSANSSLLFGSEGGFNTFSLVPQPYVVLTTNRIAPGPVSVLAQDTGNSQIDGGLIIYPNSTFTTPNLLVGVDATVFNAGTLFVGSP